MKKYGSIMVDIETKKNFIFIYKDYEQKSYAKRY